MQCVRLYPNLIGVSAESMLHILAGTHKYRIIFNFVCMLQSLKELLINAQGAGSDPRSSAMLGLEQGFSCSARQKLSPWERSETTDPRSRRVSFNPLVLHSRSEGF